MSGGERPLRASENPGTWSRVLRERPEIVLIPTAAFLLALNVGPWGFGPNYLVVFVLFFTLQRSNAIFPLTWSLSVALFASTWWLVLRRTPLAPWRAFVIAGTLPFAAVSLFEIPYDLAYFVTFHAGATRGGAVFDLVSIASWLAVGFTSVGWWKITRSYGILLAAFVTGFVVWFAIGFPAIDSATGGRLVTAYAFNIVLKIACFPLAAWPLWERLGVIHRVTGGKLGVPAEVPPA